MQEIFKWKKLPLTQIDFHTDQKDRKMIPDVFFPKKREKNIQGYYRKFSYIENYTEILFEIMRMRPNKNYQKKKDNFG